MPEIVEHIHNEGIKRGCANPIVLISNGLAMKEEYLYLFKAYDVHLSMSLPGYETFKEHTGVDNADGVLRWFSKAKEVGLSTTLNVTVTQNYIQERIPALSIELMFIECSADVVIRLIQCQFTICTTQHIWIFYKVISPIVCFRFFLFRKVFVDNSIQLLPILNSLKKSSKNRHRIFFKLTSITAFMQEL